MVLDGVVGYHLFVLLRRDASAQARTQVRAALGIVYHVPHLGLAHGVVAPHGQLVVGVHLDGEVVPGVDEFYQQGELAAEASVVGFAHQGSLASPTRAPLYWLTICVRFLPASGP